MGGRYERKTPKMSVEERFFSRTRWDESGCLIWTGGLYDEIDGYGGFSIGGRHMRAHRAVWLLTYGEDLTRDQHLLHSCDTRLCVNVEHLRVGTPSENSLDKESRGRGNQPRGTANWRTKYSDETVADVLRWHEEGASVQEIMDRVGCSRRWVEHVVAGRVRTRPAGEASRYGAARAAGRARAAALADQLHSQSGSIIHSDDFLSDDEEWRATAYDGYFVSSFGRVRGRRGRILKPILKETGSGGYWVVACGAGNQRAIHTLVCAAWHGEQPVGKEVAHQDGDHLNNVPGNLRWATRAENMADKVKHGRASGGSMPGEKHPSSKLTWEMAREIRSTPIGPRGSLKLLAQQYGVSRTTIRYIQTGKNWIEPVPQNGAIGH
ncbi:HNH endonuclease [Arthrobacter sp. ok362]|uniref:HNH endonuclease n=1 Tax=Arthrobacter sp. ok362 TaxID=1761745 RepID=UPI00087E3352|nr:HNH endonuclease [Arthrobacter sp. ok362]